MTLKEIKTRYSVSDSYDKTNQYILSGLDNDHGKYLPRKFYCVIEKVGTTKFKIVPSKHFDGVLAMNTLLPTKDVDMLCACIDEYVSSLPFHPDIYYPRYRENCFYEYACGEYLTGIGFKHADNDVYVLENKDVFGKSNTIELKIDGVSMFDKANSVVTLRVFTGDYNYVSIETERNIDKIISSINGLLRPLFLGNSIKQFGLLDKLNKTDVNYSNITKTTVSLKSLSSEHEDYKEKLIGELEEMLIELKKVN